jgi:hypothetical protein
MRSVVKLCAALTLAAPACNTALPGEEIGSYRVQMLLRENTCGAGAIHEQNGHTYRVQLREDGTTGYWRVSGQQPVQGQYATGQFLFTLESAVAQSTEDAGPFCQLLQSERLSGSVALPQDSDAALVDAQAPNPSDPDAGGLPTSGLVGEHRFTISAAPGTDCSEALAPRGAFRQLPCLVRYELRGTETASF